MATSSIIAVKTDKGYEAIYCHHDGYPSYMYPMLETNYGSFEQALALVSLGDASAIYERLAPTPGSAHSFYNPERNVCIFYHRDRGEAWQDTAPQVYFTKQHVLRMQYYVYIFEDGNWTAYTGGRRAL